MSENLTICIARQFGSGGRDIGKKVAAKLGIEFYDKELLHAAAKKSGIMQELFEKADEKPTGSLLFSLSAMGAASSMGAASKMPSFADYTSYMPNDRLQTVIAEVIRDAAEAGPCVIIGRCADYILRGRKNTLSVFIHAPLEQRIKRIARLHNLDEDAARSLIRKTDRGRANYYGFYSDRDWSAVDNYDLALNAGRLGDEGAASLVAQAIDLFCPGAKGD